MSEKWLFGTIREIPDMPDGTAAAVALDTDDDHALCIRSAPPEGNWGTHFAIGWLGKDEKQVNWLAYVVALAMKRSYCQGRNHERAKTNSDLAGLHRLLKRMGG